MATDIPYPVNLGFGDDGSLYVTLPAFGDRTGEGQGALVRLDPGMASVSLAGIGDAEPTC